jgi:cell wall-associated NlpC family hydrolase
MKTVKCILGVPILFLAVLVFGSPALAVESSTPEHSTAPIVAQTDLLQLGTQLQFTRFDCSHLVHSLYERVGLHYQYATSRTLYRGIEEFQRVPQPKSGDLVVWRGHMGIVVDPLQHSFLSALRARVKISSYVSDYWKHRGSPRFFRFASSAERTDGLGRAGAPTPDPSSPRVLN